MRKSPQIKYKAKQAPQILKLGGQGDETGDGTDTTDRSGIPHW